MIATKQQQLTISISTINNTDYFGKGISIHFFCYNNKILLFETTCLKLPNLLLLTVLTNFSRNVTLNVLSRATVGYLLFFALEQLGGSLQRRKMRIYDS
jgi:hypothetical protein